MTSHETNGFWDALAAWAAGSLTGVVIVFGVIAVVLWWMGRR